MERANKLFARKDRDTIDVSGHRYIKASTEMTVTEGMGEGPTLKEHFNQVAEASICLMCFSRPAE